jgi:hypothetical protein
MSEIIKPIGFIQEDFHSEVLDFLFELCSNINPNIKLVLYNKTDRYDNKKIYLEKYKNLSIKALNYFIPDLVSKSLHKCFIISYDNIFHLQLLENYKEDLIFIAHSEKHVKSYNLLNINFFALTPLLYKNYMLPIVNKLYSKKTIIESKLDNYLKYLKNLRDTEKLHIVMTVGYFLENNKNLKLIDELLSTNKIILIVFAPEMSNNLNGFIKKYPKNIFTAIELSTELIKYCITYLNIENLLFVPAENSNFFKESWSGTLAFGLDNNMKLIMPQEISDIYDFKNDHILPYKDINDIKDCIFNNKKIYNGNLQSWKDMVFSRNKGIISNLLSINQNENLNLISIIKEKLDKKNGVLSIIDTHSLFGDFGKSLLDKRILNKECKIYNFEYNLKNAKKQKEIYIENDYYNNTKIFNNYVGAVSQKNVNKNGITLDMFNLDDLFKNIHIHLIKIGNESESESETIDIINGTQYIISKYKPIIVIENNFTLPSNDVITLPSNDVFVKGICDLLKTYKYTLQTIENYNIFW